MFKSFLLKEWKYIKVSIKGVTVNKEKITKQKESVEIINHNKIIKIGKVYQYDNIECDIILGNDFLQQFAIYQQTVYVTPHILGVPLTTLQPAETCGYRVPRYHTHMSHVSRPIPAYLIHNIQKYMIDYNQSLFTVPLIPKRCTCFGYARI